MSRLYIRHTTDLRGEASHQGSERATIEIRWGSRDQSHLAARAEVAWPKASDRPVVDLRAGPLAVLAVDSPLARYQAALVDILTEVGNLPPGQPPMDEHLHTLARIQALAKDALR